MRKMMIGALALGCAALGGCTTFMPAPSPRIAEVSSGYVKDGRVIGQGAFGGGLVEAVAGNPEAEAHARKYRGLLIGGFVVGLAGAGLIGGGVYFVSSGSGSGSVCTDPTDPSTCTPSGSNGPLGWGLLGGGLGLLGIGLILQAVGVADKIDAINLYNEGVSRAPAPPMPLAPPPPPPSGALAPRRETTADVLLR